MGIILWTFGFDGKKLEFDTGYTTSFQVNGEQRGADGKFYMRYYKGEEYDKYVYECVKRSGGLAMIGVFGGEPEISFHEEDRKTMLKIAEDFNQKSAWDCNKCEEIKNEYWNPITNPINKEI